MDILLFAQASGAIVVFGGADREQVHYNDGLAFKSSAITFEVLKSDGDIPMERSGHQSASYGKYQFLFGGINFSEESVFNDLYIFDTGMRSL